MGADRVRDREAESADRCRRELKLNAGCVQSASNLDANWMIVQTIGDTWDASSNDAHEEFVTRATSDET